MVRFVEELAVEVARVPAQENVADVEDDGGRCRIEHS